MKSSTLLLSIVGVFLCTGSAFLKVEAADILAIFPFPGPSQYILVQPFLKELAARGHDVTVINAFPQKVKIANFTDIPVTEVHNNYNEFIKSIIGVKLNRYRELENFASFVDMVTLTVLENQGVQQLIHSNRTFDLMICETLAQEPLYALAKHFNAHLIGMSSVGTDPRMDELMGNPSPPSYLPLITATMMTPMNFWERLENLYLHITEVLHEHLIHFPSQKKIYRKYFPNSDYDIIENRKNFSLLLLNNHFTLSFPRPYVPNIIEVGGLHINHKPKPLPADMENFLNASRGDVIYFSMGSNVKSKDFSPEKLKSLMDTFASLKQNVMWKFEKTDLPGKPDNVFISQWYPQPDILAHPKVKLFVTHGGLLSTTEAIYHGKPVIGIPFFYDQFLNIERAKRIGYGLGVDFATLTKHQLKSAIDEVFSNPRYAERAAIMSKRYRDQPMTPLETAIYWTEYVLRHDGAHHLRVAAMDLNFFQYHSLDTMAVLFGGLALTLIAAVALAVRISRILLAVLNPKIKQKTQ